MEPTGHCPYVGLKQNRAIRFSSPTPEHRCFIGGDPIDIPVDQASYCLSRNHTQCPLYMGLTPVTTPEVETPTPVIRTPPPARGVAAWLAGLPPRDRVVYLAMIALLSLIVLAYLVIGLSSLAGMPTIGAAPTSQSVVVATTQIVPTQPSQPSATILTITSVPATPTNLPTSTPSPVPTNQPTNAPIYFPPTATAVPPTATAVPVTPTLAPPTKVAQATALVQPTKVAQATQVVLPTQVRPTQEPQPTKTPIIVVQSEIVWLYFGDTTNTLYVPTQRRVSVENRQSARAALLALIDGPRTDLAPLLSHDTQLLGVRIESGTAYTNFDRDPSAGDPRGYDAIVLTLTHFSSISRVQIQVNGTNLGGPRTRPVVNPINPLGLPTDPRQTEFLPLYFLSTDGRHHIRVIRMVPKTKQTAEGTVRALLEGPGGYSYALQRVIPEGTDLRAISISNGVVTVDFSQPFADASNRAEAVRTVTESLTTLPGVHGVHFLVEGTDLGQLWGAEYGRVFERGLINAE